MLELSASLVTVACSVAGTYASSVSKRSRLKLCSCSLRHLCGRSCLAHLHAGISDENLYLGLC